MNRRRFRTVSGTLLLTGIIAGVAVAQNLKPRPVLHDLAGRDNCLMCHEVGAMEPVTDVPESHAGWESATCLWCHAPDSPVLTIDPKVIPHDIAGRDDCLMCHAPYAMDAVPSTPDSHEGRQSSHCQMCHKIAD